MFATKPEDYEKYFCVEDGGDYAAETGHFEAMAQACEKEGCKLVPVIDAEGQFVCFAPTLMAELIARLLDETDEIQPGL